MSELKCLECGKPLVGQQRKFCSNPCKWKYYTKREAKERQVETRKCKECGKEFQVAENSQKMYCSSVCRYVARDKAGTVEHEDIERASTEDLIDSLHNRGYFVQKVPLKRDEKFYWKWRGKKVKLGIVSDTHLGSQYQQLSCLRSFYEHMAEEGIKKVLHAGDVCDGNGKVYAGHEYEIFVHGADKMRDYVVENYPKVEGVQTYFIGGNHDFSFQKSGGMDFGAQLAERRSDLHYLGDLGAYINIAGVKFYLLHPDGGIAYARSYKPQKEIEQFAPEAKPRFFLCGHWHVTSSLPLYRNVTQFSLPCFQAQTPYLRRKNLNPEIGGLILEFEHDQGEVKNVTPRWYNVYRPKKEDY